MDSLHAIGFYASSGVSVAGALGVALLQRRDQRGAALGVVGLGLAGIYVSLSAGFAALVALACYFGAAWLIATPQYRSIDNPAGAAWRQLGAVGAAGLLAVIAYSAFRGDFVHAIFYGGEFGATALGRLVFAHDAFATEAIAALVVAALAGATAAWRARERGR
jgi:NADH:ubiquinone oxidoreductase subunit 6 (subunit J)